MEIWIPILVAAIGVFTALYQVKLNIIASARVEWMHQLREAISNYITAVSSLNLFVQNIRSRVISNKELTSKEQRERFSHQIIKERQESLDRLNSQILKNSSLVKLHLNPAEKSHINLINSLEEFAKVSNSSSDWQNKEKLEKILEDCIEKSQIVLSDSWRKTKKFRQK